MLEKKSVNRIERVRGGVSMSGMDSFRLRLSVRGILFFMRIVTLTRRESVRG